MSTALPIQPRSPPTRRHCVLRHATKGCGKRRPVDSPGHASPRRPVPLWGLTTGLGQPTGLPPLTTATATILENRRAHSVAGFHLIAGGRFWVIGDNLGDGQADQLGVGEARRSARTLAHAEQSEEVVDFDVACHDEGVEFGLHTPVLGALALLVTACFFFTANSESII